MAKIDHKYINSLTRQLGIIIFKLIEDNNFVDDSREEKQLWNKTKDKMLGHIQQYFNLIAENESQRYRKVLRDVEVRFQRIMSGKGKK